MDDDREDEARRHDAPKAAGRATRGSLVGLKYEELLCLGEKPLELTCDAAALAVLEWR